MIEKEYFFKAEGTNLEDVTRNAGYYGMVATAMNTPITAHEESIVRDSLPSSLREQVKRGLMRIVPRSTITMKNGQDEVRGIDFDLAQVERRTEPTYTDPIWIVKGPTAYRTGQFLKEILEEEIRKDVIKAGLSDGVDSKLFKMSVADLARLLKKDMRVVYDECVQLIISGSVTTMKGAIVPSVKTETIERKTPIAVR